MNDRTLHVTTVGEHEVVLTRSFAAPPELVYEALTTAALLRRWYGPSGWNLEICDVDLRVGGAWRNVLRNPAGKRIGQHGVYRELVAGARIVFTESWEDWDPGECLVTTVLVARGEHTELSSTIAFPSREVRDVVLANGLEHGTEQAYDKLAALLDDALRPTHADRSCAE